MSQLKFMLLIGAIISLTGCSYKSIERPGAIPGGYYNAYYNKNAIILYKRPSSKFGCWLAPNGWDCIRR